jgi:TPR repeat protein
MYEKGQGVAKSLTEAAKWFQTGADQGDTSAQLKIGKMYAAGQGVVKDPVQAWEWLDLASASEKEAGALRDGVARRMTAAQIGKARELEAKWKRDQQDMRPVGLFGQ